MRRSPALVLAALLLPTGIAGLAGCSDDDGGRRLAADDGFSVEAALSELPVVTEDDGPGFELVLFDLEEAAEVNGAGPPPPGGRRRRRPLADRGHGRGARRPGADLRAPRPGARDGDARAG